MTSTRTSTWMRLALLTSLAFNAAVVAGISYGAYFSKTSAISTREPGPLKQLDLTPQQQKAVERSNLDSLKRILSARDEMRTQWAKGVDLLGRPTLDWEAIRAQETRIAQAHEKYQSLFFESWMDRARLVSDAQRQKLFAILSAQIKTGEFFKWKAPEVSPRKANQ